MGVFTHGEREGRDGKGQIEMEDLGGQGGGGGGMNGGGLGLRMREFEMVIGLGLAEGVFVDVGGEGNKGGEGGFARWVGGAECLILIF